MTEYRRKARTAHAVKVKLLPVPHSTSFSAISFAAKSTKFCPAAMHRDHMIDIELFQLRHNRPKVIVRRG
jgi:hypothetical protein